MYAGALTLALCTVLSACGGGGGGSSSSADTPVSVVPPPPPPSPPSPPAPPPPAPSGAPDPRPINTSDLAPLASIDPETGALHYGLYANEAQSNTENLLPDFSHAGYGGGGVALPSYASIPVLQTLDPVSSGDDLARIQAAIDAVAAEPADARGIRGAVLLRAGRYRVSDAIQIDTSGVILRGEGQGEAGTIIASTSNVERSAVIIAEGDGSGRRTRAASNDERTRISQSYVAVGSISVEVSSAAGFEEGDRITILRTPNAEWIGPNGIDTAQFDWDTDSYTLAFDRVVTAVVDNTVYFDVPTVDVIEDQYGGGEIYLIDVEDRLQQVGVENLRIETQVFDDVTDENRAYFGIIYEEVENSWMRDLTGRYFSHTFNFDDGAIRNTMQNVASIDPNFPETSPNLYPFNMNGGQLNLIQRCYAEDARHSVVTGSRVQGPNVFLDCAVVRSLNDDGPHQRWATGTLYDNIRGQLLRFQNRETFGTGHGWAGGQQLSWNSVYDRIVVQAPVGAMNYAVGTVGTIVSGSFDGHPDGIYESHDVAVEPRSLYLQQIEDRLGASAVEAITIPEQREGRIWDMLENWRGEGPLE